MCVCSFLFLCTRTHTASCIVLINAHSSVFCTEFLYIYCTCNFLFFQQTAADIVYSVSLSSSPLSLSLSLFLSLPLFLFSLFPAALREELELAVSDKGLDAAERDAALSICLISGAENGGVDPMIVRAIYHDHCYTDLPTPPPSPTPSSRYCVHVCTVNFRIHNTLAFIACVCHVVVWCICSSVVFVRRVCTFTVIH